VRGDAAHGAGLRARHSSVIGLPSNTRVWIVAGHIRSRSLVRWNPQATGGHLEGVVSLLHPNFQKHRSSILGMPPQNGEHRMDMAVKLVEGRRRALECGR
jgi:hypothetical protein